LKRELRLDDPHFPIAPSQISFNQCAVPGWQRHMNASIKNTRCRRQASCIATTSARFIASGFSQRMCLPGQRPDRVLAMPVVEKRNVNDVDFWIVEEALSSRSVARWRLY